MADFFPIAAGRFDASLSAGKTRFLVVGIPWTMIEPHEAQAQKNHQKSLKRLAAEGGLPVYETLMVLDGHTWGHNRRQSFAQMHDELHDRVLAFEAGTRSAQRSADPGKHLCDKPRSPEGGF